MLQAVGISRKRSGIADWMLDGFGTMVETIRGRRVDGDVNVLRVT